jgi:hypothetical protein
MAESQSPNEKLGSKNPENPTRAYEEAHGKYEDGTQGASEKEMELSSALPMAPQKAPYTIKGGT